MLTKIITASIVQPDTQLAGSQRSGSQLAGSQRSGSQRSGVRSTAHHQPSAGRNARKLLLGTILASLFSVACQGSMSSVKVQVINGGVASLGPSEPNTKGLRVVSTTIPEGVEQIAELKTSGPADLTEQIQELVRQSGDLGADTLKIDSVDVHFEITTEYDYSARPCGWGGCAAATPVQVEKTIMVISARALRQAGAAGTSTAKTTSGPAPVYANPASTAPATPTASATPAPAAPTAPTPAAPTPASPTTPDSPPPVAPTAPAPVVPAPVTPSPVAPAPAPTPQ